jgi:hypothetical protein
MKTKSICAKDISDFPLLKKLDFTQYGLTAKSPQFQSALLLHSAASNFLLLERVKAKLPRHLRKHITQHQNTAWQSFIRNFEKSVATGDVSLWRVLADIIETTKSNPKGVMPGSALLASAIMCSRPNTPTATRKTRGASGSWCES